jgi:hypothetical protein
MMSPTPLAASLRGLASASRRPRVTKRPAARLHKAVNAAPSGRQLAIVQACKRVRSRRRHGKVTPDHRPGRSSSFLSRHLDFSYSSPRRYHPGQLPACILRFVHTHSSACRMSDDGAGTCSIIELEGAIAGYAHSLHSTCTSCLSSRMSLRPLTRTCRCTGSAWYSVRIPALPVLLGALLLRPAGTMAHSDVHLRRLERLPRVLAGRGEDDDRGASPMLVSVYPVSYLCIAPNSIRSPPRLLHRVGANTRPHGVSRDPTKPLCQPRAPLSDASCISCFPYFAAELPRRRRPRNCDEGTASCNNHCSAGVRPAKPH